MAVIAGPASTTLGADVARLLGVQLLPYACRRFPDGETEIELEQSVRGADVYVLQATRPPVEDHLMELLLLADACHRAGADRLTAVIPYFGYARQDRRTARRALGARVAANVVQAGAFDRLMLVDAHTAAIEGFFDVPIDHLTAMPVLGDALALSTPSGTVVVAPDLGAVKLAREYARRLSRPMAFVHKTRLSGEQVEAHGVIGDVRGLAPLIVDDMISTGGTIAAAVGALRAAGAIEPVTVAATHALLVGPARDTLKQLHLARLIASDTVPVDRADDLPIAIVSIAPVLAAAISRNHFDESLADLLIRA